MWNLPGYYIKLHVSHSRQKSLFSSYSNRFFFFFNLDTSGLSCGMKDVQFLLMDSLVVMCGFSCSKACGILASDQPGIKPTSPALQGIFSTSKVPQQIFDKLKSYFVLGTNMDFTNPIIGLLTAKQHAKCNAES